MKALILPKVAAGRSLLALLAIALSLGLAAGEAAAVTVSGAVKLGGAFVSGQTVVATTTAPNYCFLGEGITSATPNSSGNNYSFSLSNKQITDCTLKVNQDILVFVDVSSDSYVAALHDSIEKAFQFTGANITANFDLVRGVGLSGDVFADSTQWNEPASGVTVFATNPDEGWKFIGQTETGTSETGTPGRYTLYAPPGEGSVNSAVELAVDASKITKYAGLSVDPPFIDLDITSTRDLINCSAPCTGVGALHFTLVDTLIVKGKVLLADPADPLDGTLVEAFLVDPNKGWIWLDDDLTDAQGNYELKVSVNLKNQTILLRVTHNGYVEQQVSDVRLSPDYGTTNTVTVPDITLAKAVVVSGTVTDVTNGSPGTPVPDITVLALAADSTILALAQTDANNGVYSLDLQPGTGTGYNIFVHVVTAGTIFAPEPDVGPLAVTTGNISGINFELVQVQEVITITKAEWKNKTLTVWATDSLTSLTPTTVPVLTVTARNVSGKIVVKSATMTFKGTFYELSQQVKSKLCGGTVVVSSDTGVFTTSPISCS